MKLKKVLALALAAAMTMSLVACGGSAETTETAETPAETTEAEAPAETTEAEAPAETTEAEAPAEEAGELSYASIVLGESYTDVTTTIKWIHHKTDREEDGTIEAMIAKFNEVYAKYFTEKPARSCVAVKTLPKNVLCEIEAIAEE